MDAALEGVFRGEAVDFETSGSTGGGKVVRLSSRALLASAAAVNAHLGATAEDVWVRAIPARHVGGFGILVRARLAGGRVLAMEGKWDVGRFVGLMGEGTLASLVPTQVFDLVEAEARCPAGVRAVVVGGGALEDGLCAAARELGWPVLRSYGMTEAGSQIATEALGGGRMRLLGDWEIRAGEDGVAEVRGSALFDGYVRGGVLEARKRGWFRTSDRVEMGEDRVGFFVGRVRREGRVVKVLGELVNLDVIEREIGVGAVIGVNDARAGCRIVLVVDGDEVDVGGYNAAAAGPARVAEVVRVDAIPRTALGKVRYGVLAAMVG